MKKLFATGVALAVLGLSSVLGNFDLQNYVCDISACGSIGFESEDHIYGKKIADETFVSGIEISMPVCDGCFYTGVKGFFPWESNTDNGFNHTQTKTGTRSCPCEEGCPCPDPICPCPFWDCDCPTEEITFPKGVNERAHNDGGKRFEINVGFMAPLVCVPVSECICMDDIQLSGDVGYTYYWWTQESVSNPWNQVNRSNEIYAGLLADMCFRPAAYCYYDFNLEQFRFELSVGYTFDLGCCSDCLDRFSIDVNAYACWLQASRYNGDQRQGPVTGPDTGTSFPSGDENELSNGYTYGGVSVDLVYCLNECADCRVGVRWETNNDGSDCPGSYLSPANPGVANYMNQGGKESRCWWGASVDFGF